jgi:TPR repeat protein
VTAGNGTHTPAATATPTSQPAAADLEHQTLQGNGADEFVMAQRYLSGTSGQARDSAEAAKWLWKSIAKHNGPAMLVLADLYLKGDGVSKNCDQARVLLDSAALRGMAGAGEKIRHLQAFGCQ